MNLSKVYLLKNAKKTQDVRKFNKVEFTLSIFFSLCADAYLVKDTHREKAPSNKTPALTKSMNMGIWVAGTSTRLFIRGS